MFRKGEMGVGTLIVFISMLLVAAVAAGVLIQTAGTLQEKSIATGQQASSQIATHAETIEISATDGRNANLTDFNQLIKLAPGSDAIKLEQVILTFNTRDKTATLKYRGVNGPCQEGLTGYDTLNEESIIVAVGSDANNYTLAEDLDEDGAVDYMYVNASAGNDELIFNLSSAGILYIDLGDDISAPINITVEDAAVSNGTVFAYVSISGEADGNVISSSANFVVTPAEEGQGYFTAVYEQQSTNYIAGTMQKGDMIKLCYEAPRGVGEDEDIRVNFIPKIGTATTTEFTTPDVISTQRTYLYP